MSAKQAIKQIVPRPIWAKLQSVKETHNGRKAEKIQIQRFMRWISLDSSTDKERVQTRLAFDIHRLEKGLSHIHFRLGFGKGVLSEISKRLILLEKQIRHIPQIRYITRAWQHCMNISNVMKNKVMILLRSKPCFPNPFGRLRKSVRPMIQRLRLAHL